MPDRKSKKDEKPFRLQEHVEWIAVAFVLALTVRCFVVEAYQIPTGSMAPTLYGKHYTVTCSRCGVKFIVGARENGGYSSFMCPACESDGSGAGAKTRFGGGDRILVAKDLYLFSKPRRWEVFVFKSPQTGKEPMNFVKRIVGLPGEHVELRNGQVFINGSIVSKPGRVQKELWQPVYSDGYRKEGLDAWAPSGGWQVAKEGLLLADASQDWQTVSYGRRISDFYAYNGQGGDNLVSDILVSGHLRMDGDLGAFTAATWTDAAGLRRTTKAVFRSAGASLEVELRINEEVVNRATVVAISSRDFDFVLSTADGVTEIGVSGRTVLRHVETMQAADSPYSTKDNGVFFQGSGAKMLVSDVELKRDIYYCSTELPGRGGEPSYVEDIPEGSYLALGDNSPKSNDSRMWGMVPEENVLGKAFFLFWPVTRVGPVY